MTNVYEYRFAKQRYTNRTVMSTGELHSGCGIVNVIVNFHLQCRMLPRHGGFGTYGAPVSFFGATGFIFGANLMAAANIGGAILASADHNLDGILDVLESLAA